MTAKLARASLAYGSALLFAAACGRGEANTTAPNATVDRRYVTGEAAAALDANGEIHLKNGGPADGSEIDEARAVQLAKAYLHDYGKLGLAQYEADRGAPIDLFVLVPCERAYYATSAYDETTLAVSEYGRRVLGSWWLVSFCRSDGAPEISIAVSARATNLQIGSGSQQLPNPGDNFFTSGIPTGISSVPPAPEGTIAAVAASAGERVSEVPELVLPLRPFAPQLARWRVTLEAPINLRGSKTGRAVRGSELFYGFGDTWRTSSLQIGDSATTRDEPFRDIENGRIVVTTVQRKPGLPRDYEPAFVEAP